MTLKKGGEELGVFLSDKVPIGFFAALFSEYEKRTVFENRSSSRSQKKTSSIFAFETRSEK